MTPYLDSSALVKRFLDEPESASVEELLAGTTLATSLVARAEIASAIERSHRRGRIPGITAEELHQDLAEEWLDYVRLGLTEDVSVMAARLAREHGLRGFDAIHLATAATWGQGSAAPVVFATFDKDLWRAASSIGLNAWPPDLIP